MNADFLFNYANLSVDQIVFLHILLSIVSVVSLTTIAACISRWRRPSKPNPEKIATYESGVEPVGNGWRAVNTRLYLIGLVFILFELETILLFPWASIWIHEKMHQTTSSIWNLYMAVSGTFFILVLGIGLVYVIIKGRLAFSATRLTAEQLEPSKNKVPLHYYEKINNKYATSSSSVNTIK